MHDFNFLYFPTAPQFALPLILILIWTVTLKGVALWYAARANQKWWFIALLILNTLGLLEIAYLIWFRPENKNSNPTEKLKEPLSTPAINNP